jgi:hypothetical protein
MIEYSGHWVKKERDEFAFLSDPIRYSLSMAKVTGTKWESAGSTPEVINLSRPTPEVMEVSVTSKYATSRFSFHLDFEIKTGPTGLTLDRGTVASVGSGSQGEQLGIKLGWYIIGIYRLTKDGLREAKCKPCLKAVPDQEPWSVEENFLVRFGVRYEGYSTVTVHVANDNVQLKKVDHPDAFAFWGPDDD